MKIIRRLVRERSIMSTAIIMLKIKIDIQINILSPPEF